MTTVAQSVPWADVPDPGCCLAGCTETHTEGNGISEWRYWGGRTCQITVLDIPTVQVKVTRFVGVGEDDDKVVTTRDATVYCWSAEDDLSAADTRTLADALLRAAELVETTNGAKADAARHKEDARR